MLGFVAIIIQSFFEEYADNAHKKVIVTYKTLNGRTYQESHRKDDGVVALAVSGFLIFITIQLYEITLDVFMYLFESPFVLSMPICASGFIAALNKNTAESLARSGYDSVFSFHLVIGFFLSFIVTFFLASEDVFSISGFFDFLTIYIPLSLFIFLGLLAPISIGITTTVTYFRVNKKLGWVKNPVSIVFVITMVLAVAKSIDAIS